MKHHIIPTENTLPSCIGFDDTWLMISTKETHDSFDSLQYYTESFHKSRTNGYDAIALDTIKEVQYHLRYEEFFIKRSKPNSYDLQKYYLSIQDEALRSTFCDNLAQECGLTFKQEFYNRYAKIWSHLTITVLTIFMIWILNIVAKDGIQHTGRPIREFMGEIIKMIGPEIFTILGSALALYYIYKIILNIVKPTKTITYT